MTTAATVLTTLVATAAGQLSPPPGHAMEFNGTNAFVAVADDPLLDFNTTATIEMWVRPTSRNRGRFLYKGDGVHGGSDQGFGFQVNDLGQYGCGFFMANGTYSYAISPSPVEPNWHHVAASVNTATGTTLFVDGVQVAFQATTNLGLVLRNSSRRITIGGDPNHGGWMFSGAIDELRIWNVARTQSQIAANMTTTIAADSAGLVAYYTFDEGDGTTVQDRTGNGLNGTVNGGATWAEVGCVPPAATGQPVARTTCEGESVSFTAAFSGTSPSLQWRRDGQPIAGATGATLTIASPTVVDAGMYDCVATNACGSATTVAAMLEVTPLLSIETQPASQSVGVDSTVSFLVQVRATDGCDTPPTFQWQRRNPLVADADAPDAWFDLQEGSQFINVRTAGLIISKPLPGIATGFRCRIGGGCGCRPASGFMFSETVNFNIACPADFNADGGVDFGDVGAFFERWENGC
ncbi:MAG: LamG-like jellyroll fold domain-containing protein [Phycisphaerae bacterium]